MFSSGVFEYSYLQLNSFFSIAINIHLIQKGRGNNKNQLISRSYWFCCQKGAEMESIFYALLGGII